MAFSLSEIVISGILLVTILAIIGVIIWMRIDTNKKQNSLKDDITKLSGTITQTQSSTSSLKDDLTNLSSVDKDIKYDITKLHNIVSKATATIEDKHDNLTNAIQKNSDNLERNWEVQEQDFNKLNNEFQGLIQNDQNIIAKLTSQEHVDISFANTLTRQEQIDNSLSNKLSIQEQVDSNLSNRLSKQEQIDRNTTQRLLDMQNQFRTNKLRLGDKWQLSGVGDDHSNDDWLRFMNVDGADYFGGIAVGKMWTKNLTIDNGNGTSTHLPFANDKKNYLRGDTNIDGELRVNQGKGLIIDNGNGTFSHFPWSQNKQNYLRGNTNIDGELIVHQGKGLTIDNGNGSFSHFPWKNKENYIRGVTHVDGILNVNDSLKAKSEICINNVCIDSKHLEKLKSL